MNYNKINFFLRILCCLLSINKIVYKQTEHRDELIHSTRLNFRATFKLNRKAF